MAFQPQKREEFLNSLKNIEINRPPEEKLIYDFTPDGLSSLYKLFLKLKGILINDDHFDYLSNVISSNLFVKYLLYFFPSSVKS